MKKQAKGALCACKQHLAKGGRVDEEPTLDPELGETLQAMNSAVPSASTATSFVDCYGQSFTLRSGAVQY